MLRKLLNSATSDRYKRSLPEWALIVKEAEEKSPRTAARKYPGMTPDGKEVRLSSRYIREKIPETQEFFATYDSYEFIFLTFVGIVMKKVGQDSELMAAYRQYEKEYDQNQVKEREREREAKSKIDPLDRAEEDYHYNQQNSDNRSYEYFVIRHYDPEFRTQDRRKGHSA